MRALVLLALILPGCATLGQRESSVTLPSGEVYMVRCQHDATLEFKQGETAIKVNNQGKSGPIDSLISLLTLGIVRSAEK